jgi:hypothetical protein
MQPKMLFRAIFPQRNTIYSDNSPNWGFVKNAFVAMISGKAGRI